MGTTVAGIGEYRSYPILLSAAKPEAFNGQLSAIS
jgi:hypothetical protein